MAEFFLPVPPGWEDDLMRELDEIEPLLLGLDGRPSARGFNTRESQFGGVAISCEPVLGLQLNFFTKLASRVLLRIGKFQATEFFQLENGFKRTKLEPWLGVQPVQLKIEAQKSKIGNEKRILEVAQRVWGARISEEASQTLHIRNEHDQFLISLDLSGDHLHRRGSGRELGGPAPIRETLASMLVRFLVQTSPLSELQRVTLIDPLAGSGTLLSEASAIFRPLATREFAFQSQPWIPKILKSASFLGNYRQIPQKTWAALVALDQAAPARERLQELQTLLPEPMRVLDPADSAAPAKDERTWVIANPPYGERLQAIGDVPLRDLLLRSNPDRVAVILPERLASGLRKVWPTAGWDIQQMPVSNGGLRCHFLRMVLTDAKKGPAPQAIEKFETNS